MLRLVSAIADGVAMLANAVATIMVIALIAVVNYDIVARSLFNRPFMGAVEVVQFTMVLIVFLQLPDVIRANHLTRSDGFATLLSARLPAAGRALSRATDAVSAAFMLVVAIAIWPEFTAMWESRDYFGVPGVFTAPWWPVKLTIFASACLCALHFALKILLAGRPGNAGQDREPTR